MFQSDKTNKDNMTQIQMGIIQMAKPVGKVRRFLAWICLILCGLSFIAAIIYPDLISPIVNGIMNEESFFGRVIIYLKSSLVSGIILILISVIFLLLAHLCMKPRKVKNKNGRVYSQEAVMNAFKDIPEQVEFFTGEYVGEVDHPCDNRERDSRN